MHGQHLGSEIPGRVSPRLLRGILGLLRYMELWGLCIRHLDTWEKLKGRGTMTSAFEPLCTGLNQPVLCAKQHRGNWEDDVFPSTVGNHTGMCQGGAAYMP